MDPWASIRSIAINPTNSRIIVAGDWHTGVYVTATGTEPWQCLNSGLSTRAVTSLAYSHDGRVLYAATDGGGLFRASPGDVQDGVPDLEDDLLREAGRQ
jgi:hypothetical protein